MKVGPTKLSIPFLMLLILLGFTTSVTLFAQTPADQNQQLLTQLNQLRQQQMQVAQGTTTTTTTTQAPAGPGTRQQYNLDTAAGQAPPSAPNAGGPASPAELPPPRLTRPFQPSSTFRAPFNSSQVPLSPEDQVTQEQAFAGAVRNLLPMSPEQIHRLRQLYTASQFAAAVPPGTPPKPTSTSLFVNLSPGATPPVIRLAEGFVTSLVFLDATGASWPIEAYDIGNPAAFNIQWNKTDNTLMVQATSLYTYGNLAVRLRGLGTPVMLTLMPGQPEVDYRVDVRIPEYGPNAITLPINTGLPNTESPVLLNVLNGIPPAGAKLLRICGGAGQAWSMGDRLFIRTRLTLLSPGWVATMSSADGTKAYELQSTPMILVAENGKAVQLKVEGW